MKSRQFYHCTGFAAAVLIAALFGGCGAEEVEAVDLSRVITEAGTIEIGDTTDPNHSNLMYDEFEFEAERLERVHIEVRTGDFIPMLKLIEVETGAVLAEWEAEYSPDKALNHIIAAPGIYEARIYATEDGVGQYSITISIKP